MRSSRHSQSPSLHKSGAFDERSLSCPDSKEQAFNFALLKVVAAGTAIIEQSLTNLDALFRVADAWKLRSADLDDGLVGHDLAKLENVFAPLSLLGNLGFLFIFQVSLSCIFI